MTKLGGMGKLEELPNDELLARLRAHVGRGNAWLAGLLAYLAEVDARRLYAEHACSSMWDFCVRRLGMSESEALRRIAVARVLRRFPVAHGYVLRGELHLCAIYEMHKHLTPDNHEELLRQAAGRTTKAVAEMIAARFPRPDVHACVEPLAPQQALALAHVDAGTATDFSRVQESDSLSLSPPAPAEPSVAVPAPGAQVRPKIEPLSATRYRVELTISAETKQTLERIRDLMLHRNPTGDLERIFDAALGLLVVKLERERLGKTARPQGKTRSVTDLDATRDAKPNRPLGDAPASDAPASHAFASDASTSDACASDASTSDAFASGACASASDASTSDASASGACAHGEPAVASVNAAASSLVRGEGNMQEQDTPAAALMDGSVHISEEQDAPAISLADESVNVAVVPAAQTKVTTTKNAKKKVTKRMKEVETDAKKKVTKRMKEVETAHRQNTTRRRHIPRAIRREVFARDDEQCTFVDAQGNRCPARGYLELDHVEAKALGGPDTVKNLRLRCRAHNRWHAEQVFGRPHVEERIDLRRRKCATPCAPAFDAVARGLRLLGFREPEVRVAMAQLQAKLDPATPAETILREALGILT